MLKIIGVTGGIGSGKSTVSRILKDLGTAVVDADMVYKLVTCREGAALKELTNYFGNGILTAEGELDRAKISELVFEDAVKLHALNTITHKYVLEKVKESIEAIDALGNHDVVVYDCPLPVEHGFLDLVDEVWVVMSDRNIRIDRIVQRNGCTPEEAVRRINSQMKDEEYLKIADEVIYNNGSIEELEKVVVKLFLQKKQMPRNSKGG